MLLDCGVRFILLGHSERRPFGGELEAGLTRERVIAQTRAAFAGLSAADVTRCIAAYEPIWAIGTGDGDRPEGANRCWA
jgi:triosephosphate isomerase